MRILYVTTISATMGFFPTHIRMLQDVGHIVEFACNLDEPPPEKITSLACVAHHIPFSRAPFSRDNLTAYKALKRLLAENHYDIVHTHTPNASAIVRLVCRKLRKKGTRVFYTAHGFHFYTGAPIKNWMLYYPVERFLSRWTDVLITINQEDFGRAQTFHAKQTAFVHGVGVNTKRFNLQWTIDEKREKRRELGVSDDEFMLLSVGELNAGKNHETVIRALARIKNLKTKYFICGSGALKTHLEGVVHELGLDGRIHLLGRRGDIAELNQAADLFLFPSVREGLSVALMEAMSAGNPVICSRIRGNVDLIEDGQGGVHCGIKDVGGFAEAIAKLAEDGELRARMGAYNQARVENFSTEQVLDEMRQIYGLGDGRNGRTD